MTDSTLDLTRLDEAILEGAGFEVFDLGVDIATERFVTRALETRCRFPSRCDFSLIPF